VKVIEFGASFRGLADIPREVKNESAKLTIKAQHGTTAIRS
jgi:hypothetical protein